MWTWGQDGKPQIKDVGIWVICTGIQADAPMRQTLARNILPGGERSCEACGIVGHKGELNAVKYLGYSRPCNAEVRHHSTGKQYANCQAWGCGHIVAGSIQRPVALRPLSDRERDGLSTHLTADQHSQRDQYVEKEARALSTGSGAGDASKAARRVDAMMKAQGSRGQDEFSRAGIVYWDVRWMFPAAVYHLFYLGIAKDALKWVNVRLAPPSRVSGEPALLFPFKQPSNTRSIIRARLGQFVLRSSPSCIMVDFTSHLGHMSMNEMQLSFEVGVPYLVHDLRSFGVPPEATAMLLLLRYGMLCLTRLEPSDDHAEYMEHLREGTLCLTAYAAIAEAHGSGVKYGLNQFSHTWKLHRACCHLEHEIIARGHPIQSSDAWVERAIRRGGQTACKCEHMTRTPCSIRCAGS